MAEQWMTYAEVAEAMGVKVQAVQKRAKRNNWPKRIDNETGKAKIQIDLDALDIRGRTPSVHTPPQVHPETPIDQKRLTELEVKLEAAEVRISDLQERIGELKVDQQEKREIIEGLLEVLQDQSPPPSKGLFGWLLGR